MNILNVIAKFLPDRILGGVCAANEQQRYQQAVNKLTRGLLSSYAGTIST